MWVGGGGNTQFYDLKADPGETQDASASHPLARRWVTDAFGIFLVNQAHWHKQRWGVASNVTPQFAKDFEK
jgi:hypothetical protein